MSWAWNLRLLATLTTLQGRVLARALTENQIPRMMTGAGRHLRLPLEELLARCPHCSRELNDAADGDHQGRPCGGRWGWM